jgi:hypothetical protein
MIRRAISEGWEVDPKTLAEYRAALDDALKWAHDAGDAREVRGIVRTMAVITAQIQADEHLDRKARGEIREQHDVTFRYEEAPTLPRPWQPSP